MIFTKEDITQLYVATFNRAPDAEGLNYWMYNSGFDNLNDVASSFFDSKEAQSIYSEEMSSQEMVEMAYENLFSREADAEGLNYWMNELDSGLISQELMLQAMLNGAQGQDYSIIENKTTVGLNYADMGMYNVTDATTVMQNINYDYSSVEDAFALMNSMGNNGGTNIGTMGLGINNMSENFIA